jgi:hypothetical protein
MSIKLTHTICALCIGYTLRAKSLSDLYSALGEYIIGWPGPGQLRRCGITTRHPQQYCEVSDFDITKATQRRKLPLRQPSLRCVTHSHHDNTYSPAELKYIVAIDLALRLLLAAHTCTKVNLL